MRHFLLLALCVAIDAHGAGVWKDPNHYESDESLAGLRFVAEFPAHTLTMIGTDDGSRFWMIKGSCSGPSMTDIHFDFSSKGGPADLTGKWSKDEEGESITWPDGNAWVEMLTPTKAFDASTKISFHGLYVDPAHHAAGSFAGMRVLAEISHTLYMVGSDDGTTWWSLVGSCSGAGMRTFTFDFSPKGGPSDHMSGLTHLTLPRS